MRIKYAHELVSHSITNIPIHAGKGEGKDFLPTWFFKIKYGRRKLKNYKTI